MNGAGVTNLGHSSPEIIDALKNQASKLWHVSNLVTVEEQVALGERLCHLSGMEKAFFCNSGAEANETALKLARLYGDRKSIKAPVIVVMGGAFHGRTLATLSVTDSPGAQQGYAPLMPGFITLPLNSIEALDAFAKSADADNVAAVLVEPIQGESGVRIVDYEYMSQLGKVCREKNWLFMLDEVQTGIGRTGRWFAHQYYGVKPDVITLAKALGNGFPIGACLATGKADDLFTPGSHGSTFGGNPLGCQVALAVLDAIEDKRLLTQARKLGLFILAKLRGELSHVSLVKEIRGRGLMIGIEFYAPVLDLQKHAFSQEKLLVNVARGNTLRILPPLTMTQDETNDLIGRITRSVLSYLKVNTLRPQHN